MGEIEKNTNLLIRCLKKIYICLNIKTILYQYEKNDKCRKINDKCRIIP